MHRRELSEAIGIAQMRLVNDFLAIGHGLSQLGPRDLVTLQEGQPAANGPMALIGAGAGLGEALVLQRDGACIPYPSEGGHADFAPINDTQWAVAKYLREKYGRVSCERLLSGRGLEDVYAFFAAHGHRPRRGARSSESSRSSALRRVTSLQWRANACASSHPIGPLPILRNRPTRGARNPRPTS